MFGRVLVVDDDADILSMVRLVLERADWDVLATSSGEEAIEYLRNEDFDVVVSDLRMPGTDGLGIIDAVERNSPNTMAIIVSSDVTVDSAVEVLRAGAYHFLKKPVDFPELLSVVRQAYETRKLRATTSIYQSTQAVFGTLDVRDLPAVIVDVAVQVMDADHAVLVTPDVDGNFQIVYAVDGVTGQPDDMAANLYLDLSWRVSRDLAPLVLPLDSKRHPDVLEGTNAVVFPLVTRNLTHGVLVVRRRKNRRTFTRGDVDRLSIVAAQATLALDNATLYADLEQRLDSLERARRRITTAESLESLARFSTGVAHQLQSPTAYLQTHLRSVDRFLNRFSGVADALNGTADAEAIRSAWRAWGGSDTLEELDEALNYALEGAERVEELAGDLSRLSRERDDVVFELRQTVDAALRMAGTRVRQNVMLDLEDASVRGNPGQLAKALINILVNAEQAMAEDLLAPILVRSRTRGNEVVVEITDTGIGIDQRLLAWVTEPFFTTKESELATGLGLTVVREVIEAHGGKMGIRSKVNEGTTIAIALPVETDDGEFALGDE